MLNVYCIIRSVKVEIKHVSEIVEFLLLCVTEGSSRWNLYVVEISVRSILETEFDVHVLVLLLVLVLVPLVVPQSPVQVTRSSSPLIATVHRQ
jgi:hypothetical protein